MENKAFIEKLYFGMKTVTNFHQNNKDNNNNDNNRKFVYQSFPQDSLLKTHTKFRPKELKINDPNEIKEIVSFRKPNLQGNHLGKVIMQNWNTKKNIPKDIGNCLNLPVIIDIKKADKIYSKTYFLQKKTEKDNKKEKEKEKKKIKKTTDLVLFTNKDYYKKSHYKHRSSKKSNKSREKDMLINPSIGKDYMNYNVSRHTSYDSIKSNLKIKKDLEEAKNQEKKLFGIKTTTSFIPEKNLINNAIVPFNNLNLKQNKIKKNDSDIIDFENFDKYLYLNEGDFLYAIKKGGPQDFILCTYEELYKENEKYRKSLMTAKKDKKNKNEHTENARILIIDYITISKTAIVYYVRNKPTCYTMEEWIENYKKYKLLLNISIFRNFRTSKIFALWRKYYRKVIKIKNKKKLKKHFKLLDNDLLNGYLEIKKITTAMSEGNNIFPLMISKPVFAREFNDIHQRNLLILDKTIEQYRTEVKKSLIKSCNKSYINFKKEKKITLPEGKLMKSQNQNQEKENSDNENNKSDSMEEGEKKAKQLSKKWKMKNYYEGTSTIPIPYAQDATRRTHFKTLLKFIRSMDYIFNLAKTRLIQNSLELLNSRFERFYECYENDFSDSPILKLTLFTLKDEIKYMPGLIDINDLIFDKFIQDNIYCVIYKRSFIDPQEFPLYMTCFEEVFDTSCDQNTNLNTRIKDSIPFNSVMSKIKDNFNKCCNALNNYVTSLKPILLNYNICSKISFNELGKTATAVDLKKHIKNFEEEATKVRQLKKFINIGLFELDSTQFLEMVIDAPRNWLEKIRNIIPQIIVNKHRDLISILEKLLKELSIEVNNVETFIKLKKSCAKCTSNRNMIEEKNMEITDLLDIAEKKKYRIVLQDYDKRVIVELKNLNMDYERKYDQMTYFLENNYQQYRKELIDKIVKFDNDIKAMYSQLNEDKINKYSDNSDIPLMQLENLESQINSILENKTIFEQQEIDLDMEENERSSFDNLNNLVYGYKLKCDIWKGVRDFNKMVDELDPSQILNIDIKDMKEKINKWDFLCQTAIIDLDNCEVPKGLKKKIENYQKIIDVLIAIQNPNILNNENKVWELRVNIIGSNYEFKDAKFDLIRLMNIDEIYDKIPEINNFNRIANEEREYINLVKNKQDELRAKRLQFKFRQYNEMNKFLIIEIDKNILDSEYEYIEHNILILHQAQLNPSSNVVASDIIKLLNDLEKYRIFLEHFVEYHNYLMSYEGIIFNPEFAKELPGELKKILNENQVRNLIRVMRDNSFFRKFLNENIINKSINILKNLIDSFEKNCHAIGVYLDKRRRDYPLFYLLSDTDLIVLYTQKESIQIREKIIMKIFPWIKNINLSYTEISTNEEFITIDTIYNENIKIKYLKPSKILKDNIDTLFTGLVKKMKDSLKSFKNDYNTRIKSKNNKKAYQIIYDTIKNYKNNLSQIIIINIFCCMMDLLERAISFGEESFDKLFDMYHIHKDEVKKTFIEEAKNIDNPINLRKIYIYLISYENYFITLIEDLIRDDVQKVSDFNFIKLIYPKIENDTLNFHLIGNFLQVEYGFSYTGMIFNYILMSNSDRMILSLANIISIKKPICMYGIKESNMYETFNNISLLFGKNIQYLSGNSELKINTVNNYIYANLKLGNWLVIDSIENIKFENLEIIAERISQIYQIVKQSEDEFLILDGFEKKITITNKSFNIFLLSSMLIKPMNIYPKIIKNGYYRSIGFSNFNIEFYTLMSMVNLNFENFEEISKKIIFIIKLINAKCANIKEKNISFKLIQVISKALSKVDIFSQFNEDKQNNNKIISDVLINNLQYITYNEKEFDEIKYCIETVFNITDNKIINETKIQNKEDKDIIQDPNEHIFNTAFNEISKEYLFPSNSEFQKKLYTLYNSFNSFKFFLLSGPELCGKSTLIHILQKLFTFMSNLNESNKKLYYMKIYHNSDKIFNPISSQSNPTYKNLSLLQCQLKTFHNLDLLIRLNEVEEDLHQNWNESSLSGLQKETANIPAPSSPRKKIKRNDTQFSNVNFNNFKLENGDDISISGSNFGQGDNNEDNSNNDFYEKYLFSIILDGEIDNEYLWKNINKYTIKGNDLDNYKIIYEVCDVKKVSPTFLTMPNQLFISLSKDNFNYYNVLYKFLDISIKINTNSDLKAYIKGLFENYFPKLFDFVINNRLKYIFINENYVMYNFLCIFESLLPAFDFQDKKIGRKNINATPKIEIIKKSTLSIFIVCFAWTINNLTNYLIRTKIEKLISDLFKADDLKGPIFDYYISEETCDLEQWEVLLKPMTETITNKILIKGEIFRYSNIYIPTKDSLPIYYFSEKLIANNITFLVTGKENVGKTLLLHSLLHNENISKNSNQISFLGSYGTKVSNLKEFLLQNVSEIRRDVLADKNGRKTIFFIDDLHLINDTSNTREYIRSLIETKKNFNYERNIYQFLYKFNFLLCGNITTQPIDYSNHNKNRFIMKNVLLNCVFSEESFINIFKITLEFHLRQFIPNTSSITSSQYIQALFKLKNLILEDYTQSMTKLHCLIRNNDIVKIIQSFHIFSLNENQNDIPYHIHLKNLFFYESCRLIEDRLNKQEDIDYFRESICQAYSSIFKQDKVTANDIYDGFDNQEHFIYAKNYFDENNNNNNKYIYFKHKSDYIDLIQKKISEYEIAYNKNIYNGIIVTEDNLNFLIKILRGFERNNKNFILIGKNYTFKQSLFKLGCFIAGIKYYDADDIRFYDLDKKHEHKFEQYNNDFVKIAVKNILKIAVNNNQKVIMYIRNELIESNLNILETVNLIVNIKALVFSYDKFAGINLLKEKIPFPKKEIYQRLKNNLSVCLSIIPKSKAYSQLFVNYPYIVKNSTILYKHKFKENDMENYFIHSLNSFTQNITSSHTFTIEEENKKEILKLMISIHSYSQRLIFEYSQKTEMNLFYTNYNYIEMVNYFIKHYPIYKNILSEKLTHLSNNTNSTVKSMESISLIENEINELIPKKEENDKLIEEKRNDKKSLVFQKQGIKMKKNAEEKPCLQLKADLDLKKAELQEKMALYEQRISKSMKNLEFQEKDIVEIKNTYDNFNFGKYILTSIYILITKQYDLINDYEKNWDGIKKSLNTKLFTKFVNRKFDINDSKLLEMTKLICQNPDCSSDKYQKPYKAVGTVCDFYIQCNNYHIEYNNNSSLVNEMNDINKKINEYQEIIKGLNNQIIDIDKQIDNNDNDINNLEKVKTNFINEIENRKSMLKAFIEFNKISNEKIGLYNEQKDNISNLLQNYDYYLLFISSYISYAPILNKTYRYQFQKFIYNQVQYKGIKELDLMTLILNFLDTKSKDQNFFFSLYNYKEDIFLQENFYFIYIEKNKIPYILNSYNQIGYEMIRDYVEASRDTRALLRTNYNENVKIKDNEMLDKLNKTIKDGLILYLEKCDRNCTLLFKNILYKRTIINEKGENVMEISSSQIEPKNTKYQIYFSQNSYYDFRKEDYLNTLIINFNISASTTLKNELYKELAICYEPNLFGVLTKTKIEMQKNLIRLNDNYTKLNNSVERFNFSSNVEELMNNHNILDNYLRDIQENDFIMNNISNHKSRIININLNLMHYNTLTLACAKLFKLVNYIGDKKISFKIFRDFIKKFYIENGFNEFEEIENKNNEKENKEGNEEEEEEEENENEKSLEENMETNTNLIQIHKPKKIFSKNDYPNLISYLHNNVVDKIYDDISKKNAILFIQIMFYLKEINQLPFNYKNIIKTIIDLILNKNDELYKEKIKNENSPIDNISKDNWNKLLLISEENNNYLKSLIESLKNNYKIWEELLDDNKKDINWINKDLDLDYLKSKLNKLPNNLSIFNLFTFYIIIKPTDSIDKIIPIFITNILNDSVKLFKFNSLEEIFEDTHNKFNSEYIPLIIVEHEDDVIMYQKLINDKLYPSLINSMTESQIPQVKESKESDLNIIKKISSNQGNNKVNEEEKQQAEIKSKVFELKEDITNSEMESINQFIKGGGIIYIKNIYNVNSETVELLFNNINEAKKNETIHNTFRMVIFCDENHLNFSSIFYKECIIINYSDKALDNYDVNTHLYNIIKNIPEEFYNFYNKSIYLKKIFVTFIFIHVFLIQVCKNNPELFLFEVDINNGDLIQVFNYFRKYFDINDNEKELSNIDNDLNINYLHIINIAIDIFYVSRCAILEQCQKLKDLLDRFFDEDIFFSEEKILLGYIQDIDDYEKNDNLIIKNEDNEIITTEFLFKKINNIPSKKFDYLIKDLKTKLTEENKKEEPNRVENLLLILQKKVLKIPTEIQNVKMKIYTKKILNILSNLKHDFPEQINYGEGFANGTLFKLNKEGSLANPLDEILIIEVDNLNNQLNEILLELTNLINVIKGEMKVIYPYDSMIIQLNQDFIPYEWLRIIYLHKDNHKRNLNINDWFEKLNEKVKFFNDWVVNGYPEIYKLNYFYHPKLFFEKLKIYFCRLENKLNEKDGKTPDMIELIFNPLIKHSNDIIIDGLILEGASLKIKDKQFYIKPDNKLNKIQNLNLGYKIIHLNEKKPLTNRSEISENEIENDKDNPMFKEELYLSKKNNFIEGKVIVPFVIENKNDFEPYITEVDFIAEITCYFDTNLTEKEKENMKINSCRFILKDE